MIVFGWRNPCYLDDSVLFSFSSSFLLFLDSSFFSFVFFYFLFFSVGDDLDRSNPTTRLLGRSNIKRVEMRTIPIDNQSRVSWPNEARFSLFVFRCSVIQINREHVQIPNVWKRSLSIIKPVYHVRTLRDRFSLILTLILSTGWPVIPLLSATERTTLITR